MINIRSKGANAEREVSKIINEHFLENGINITTERNLEQVRHGGRDLINLEPFCVEIKRQEKVNIKASMQQACDAALQDEIPVLIYRSNRQPWTVRMITTRMCTYSTSMHVTISLDDFLKVMTSYFWKRQ